MVTKTDPYTGHSEVIESQSFKKFPDAYKFRAKKKTEYDMYYVSHEKYMWIEDKTDNIITLYTIYSEVQ